MAQFASLFTLIRNGLSKHFQIGPEDGNSYGTAPDNGSQRLELEDLNRAKSLIREFRNTGRLPEVSAPIPLIAGECCHRVVHGRWIHRAATGAPKDLQRTEGFLVLTNKRLVFVADGQENGSALPNIHSIGARPGGRGFTIRLHNSLLNRVCEPNLETVEFDIGVEADPHCRSYETRYPWEFVANIVCAFRQAGLSTQVDVRFAPFFMAA